MDREQYSQHLPAHPVAHANDVGAGDSLAATLLLALAAGASVSEATRIGIDAANIVVSRPRTAVISYQELLQQISLRVYTTRAATSEAAMASPVERLAAQLEAERILGHTIVFTNGVFDILHVGHVEFLRQAKSLGDLLVVAVNSDRSASRLKGPGRPINSERNRQALVAALDMVDHALLFDEDTPNELIRKLRPHIHVKGGDYTDETLPEAEAVRAVDGRVVILPLVGSMSTSNVIERIMTLASERNRPGGELAGAETSSETFSKERV
jgi:D-beta-D-heptose 7-phosphate kinase/D-beta-D-heptose 1-phosphate adenosyltransferase